MSDSTITDAGWGIFTLKPIRQNAAVAHGEVSIALPDARVEYEEALNLLLEQFAWGAHAGGAVYEGFAVHSIFPGVGSLANGHPGLANVMSASAPDIHHAGVTRHKFPGAGALSYYSNVLWRASRPTAGGEEIIVDYERVWRNNVHYGKVETTQRSLKELNSNGICLDNIRSNKSGIEGAGRGAFATRFLGKGQVVAPAPLASLPREALEMTQYFASATTGQPKCFATFQLLLNYCFGHESSSLLFFPLAPTVSMINHDSENANAKLQWSQSPPHCGKEWLGWISRKDQAVRSFRPFARDCCNKRYSRE